MAILAACMAAVAVASTAGAHDCQCRFFGQSYNQGESVCMRGKIAQCAMYLNNSSWKVVAEPCPVALSSEPRHLANATSPTVR